MIPKMHRPKKLSGRRIEELDFEAYDLDPIREANEGSRKDSENEIVLKHFLNLSLEAGKQHRRSISYNFQNVEHVSAGIKPPNNHKY